MTFSRKATDNIFKNSFNGLLWTETDASKLENEWKMTHSDEYRPPRNFTVSGSIEYSEQRKM